MTTKTPDTPEIIAARTPADFAYYASRGEWELAPHLAYLHRKLLRVAAPAGTCNRLMISMPPRHGKSELTSQYFPPWFLGTFPHKRVILTSYEHDFAASWGAKARDILKEYGPRVWGVHVAKDRQASDDWGIQNAKGGMVCAGVGGAITGRGADLLIIDDPVKSGEEAVSETYRNRAWDWYRSTAYTRLEPGGRIIIIQTRWHEDDLTGRVMANAKATGEVWENVTFPALAEEGDALGRKVGEALWPSRYPVSVLEVIRKAQGKFWPALYQQRPAPDGGSLFRQDYWRFYVDFEKPAVFDEVLQSWDMAFKDTKTSDFVVGQVWGRKGAQIYLLDQWRARMDFAETLKAVKAMTARWPQATLKLVEDKANGPAVISALRSEVYGLVAVNPQGGKHSRAQAILPLVQAGNVILPSRGDAPWIEDFTLEAASFPVGAHDDQVDAMTQALSRFLWVKEEAEPEARPDPGRRIDLILADEKRRAEEELGPPQEGYTW